MCCAIYELPGALVFCNTRNAVRHLQAMLLERGFSVVALSGELTQNERIAGDAIPQGRPRPGLRCDRRCGPGIDLPSLGLVIHADLPTDPEVLQHRSGRTGRAGRKGVSVLLVQPARRRRAELLLSMSGIEAVWAAAPTAEDIRKLDQQRMLQEDLFGGESTEDDLTLARALLAERSPEEIATALARLYSSRLPSPEEVVDPGEDGGRRSAHRRDGPDRDQRGRNTFNDEKPFRAKPKSRDGGLGEGAVWFSAAIGRRKNAEARWLLPMICRRGGIDKHQIGAIRIFDTTTEFEISADAVESFATMIRRPDKEDNIRIELLSGAPQAQPRQEKPEGRDYAKKHPRKHAYRGKSPDERLRHKDQDNPAGKAKHHDGYQKQKGSKSGNHKVFNKKAAGPR